MGQTREKEKTSSPIFNSSQKHFKQACFISTTPIIVIRIVVVVVIIILIILIIIILLLIIIVQYKPI